MGKRRAVWSVLWCLSLAAISFYGGAISFGIFFGLTLVPVISLVYLLCVYFRFKVYQEVESRNVVVGQPVPYHFILQNDDFFAFSGVGVRVFSDLSFVEGVPDGTEYELLPQESYRYDTKLVCRYRGEYEVGIREVVVTDFFRLFRVRYGIPGKIKALVLPRLVELPGMRSVPETDILTGRENPGLRSQPDIPVRDYVNGDSLKQIHWKATAREQRLKVRSRTGEEKQGISIIFDTHRYSDKPKEYLPLENKILELVLALAYFWAKKGLPLLVCSMQGGRMRKDRLQGLWGFQDFYAGMSKVAFGGEENISSLLAGAVRDNELSRSRMVFLVLHAMDKTTLPQWECLQAEGVGAVFYLVTDENVEEYVRKSNDSRKIMAVPVEADLEEVL